MIYATNKPPAKELAKRHYCEGDRARRGSESVARESDPLGDAAAWLTSRGGRFLTAEWRYLAMLNFAVDPKLLAAARACGDRARFPRRRDVRQRRRLSLSPDARARPADSVSSQLRRGESALLRPPSQAADGWRRGVAFVRELVPRRAIALVARVFYDEPYLGRADATLDRQHERCAGAFGISGGSDGKPGKRSL